MQTWPGRAYPLGATYDGSGVNFALFTEVADRVELCLIGNHDLVVIDRLDMSDFSPNAAAAVNMARPRKAMNRLVTVSRSVFPR